MNYWPTFGSSLCLHEPCTTEHRCWDAATGVTALPKIRTNCLLLVSESVKRVRVPPSGQKLTCRRASGMDCFYCMPLSLRNSEEGVTQQIFYCVTTTELVPHLVSDQSLTPTLSEALHPRNYRFSPTSHCFGFVPFSGLRARKHLLRRGAPAWYRSYVRCRHCSWKKRLGRPKWQLCVLCTVSMRFSGLL